MTSAVSRKSPSVGWALAVVLTLLLAGASAARAMDVAPYEDERDSFYLKVLYRFVYPVGKVAEVFVFRPIHTFAGVAGQPDPDMRKDRDEDSLGACLTFRPMRKCGRD